MQDVMRGRTSVWPWILLLFAAIDSAAAQRPDPKPIFERAVADFLAGRLAESVAGFDTVARTEPGLAPQLGSARPCRPLQGLPAAV